MSARRVSQPRDHTASRSGRGDGLGASPWDLPRTCPSTSVLGLASGQDLPTLPGCHSAGKAEGMAPSPSGAAQPPTRSSLCLDSRSHNLPTPIGRPPCDQLLHLHPLGFSGAPSSRKSPCPRVPQSPCFALRVQNQLWPPPCSPLVPPPRAAGQCVCCLYCCLVW